jgi:hypothetical protein
MERTSDRPTLRSPRRQRLSDVGHLTRASPPAHSAAPGGSYRRPAGAASDRFRVLLPVAVVLDLERADVIDAVLDPAQRANRIRTASLKARALPADLGSARDQTR